MKLTVAECAEKLGTSTQTVNNWLRAGMPYTTGPRKGNVGRRRVKYIEYAVAKKWQKGEQ